MNLKRKKKIVASIALASLLFGSSVYAAYSTAGPKADGTGVTSGGWYLTPAGTQVGLGNFPMDGAVSPDKKYFVAANAGTGTQSLQVVDTQQQKVVQTISYESPEALYIGLAFSPDARNCTLQPAETIKSACSTSIRALSPSNPPL